MQTYFISKDLPLGLSKEEQEVLLSKISRGDSSARDIFIVSNVRLVLSLVITHFNGTLEEMQEYVSEGIIGLIRAVDTFDISKNCAFATYAIRCINNQILMYLRKNKKNTLQISLSEAICLDKNGEKFLLEEVLCEDMNVEDEVVLNEMVECMKEAFTLLPLRDRQILFLYFGLGDRRYTQREIGSMFGISRSYVCRILQDSLFDLKKAMMEIRAIQKTKK